MIKAVKRLTPEQKNDIWELVKAADREFIPTLSSREDTTQKNLTSQTGKREPTSYYNALLSQSFILCIENGRVAGFISYIPDYHLINDKGLDTVCDYVSTVIVSPDSRRKGYTTKMYKKLFSSGKGKTVMTRTWSQNKAHIALLEKIGFKLVLTIENDRGKGIDTVYYLRGEQ